MNEKTSSDLPKDASYFLDAALEAHLRGKPVRAIKNLVWALDLDPTVRNDPAAQSLAKAYIPLPASEAFDVLADEAQCTSLLAALEAERGSKKDTSRDGKQPQPAVSGCSWTITQWGYVVWVVLLVLILGMCSSQSREMENCTANAEGIGRLGCSPSDSWCLSGCLAVAALIVLTALLLSRFLTRLHRIRKARRVENVMEEGERENQFDFSRDT